MKVLLSAFEPFNNDNINPSEEIYKRIDIDKVLLPVSYNRVEAVLDEAINKYHPDFILSLGYAASRKNISIEKYAYNSMMAKIKDNDDIIYEGKKINDGRDIIKTKIDIERIINNFPNYPLALSEDPGRFICNEVYYLSLSKTNSNALFIHVPPLNTMKEDGMDLNLLVEAIKDVIRYLEER